MVRLSFSDALLAAPLPPASGPAGTDPTFDLLSHLRTMQQGNIVLSYRGRLTGDIITSILELTEARFEDMALAPLLRKRLINILIESLQNIFHHAGERPVHQEAILIIGRVNEGFFVHTGNYLNHCQSARLRARLDKINAMSPGELRENYRFILAHKDFADTKRQRGAGIGMIDMARRSGKKICYHIQAVDPTHDFFHMQVFVDR